MHIRVLLLADPFVVCCIADPMKVNWSEAGRTETVYNCPSPAFTKPVLPIPPFVCMSPFTAIIAMEMWRDEDGYMHTCIENEGE